MLRLPRNPLVPGVQAKKFPVMGRSVDSALRHRDNTALPSVESVAPVLETVPRELVAGNPSDGFQTGVDARL
jgi:hypothetical protein